MERRYGLKKNYTRDDVDKIYAEANEKIVRLFENIPNVRILDLNIFLGKNHHYNKFSEDNMPLYYDADHLTAYAGEYIYNKLKNDKRYNWVIELAKGK